MSAPSNVYFHPKDAGSVNYWPSLIPVQSIEPASAAEVWVDTSTVPPVIKGWNGSAWAAIGSGSTASSIDGGTL